MNAQRLSRRTLRALERILGRDYVVAAPEDLLVYECDGYTIEKATPSAVLFPASTEEVSAVVRVCHAEGIPFVARGAGTGLSGGCLALHGAVQIALTRMNRVLKVDVPNRRALVEAGVVNLHVTQAVSDRGYFYAPDPSSQVACTIGGNIAENSGGPHTLRYGVTANHVLGLELVLPNGEVLWLGEDSGEPPGYDLRGAVIGSEGTFGIVTKALLRLTPQPKAYRTLLAVFDRVDDASESVSAVITRGIIPTALEMMDQLFIRAVEDACQLGLPRDAEAVLIVELDGLEAGLDAQAALVADVCRKHGARDVRLARDEAERAALWYGRKRAFGSVGRLSPSYCTQDGVIPRAQVGPVLREIAAIAQRYGLRIGNVFHAGDGNLHPVILFDERNPEEVKRVLAAGDEILRLCVAQGGSITGEHGIGVEKIAMMSLLFSPADVEAMRRLRHAFDPEGRCNPGKVLPTPEEAPRV
ncbi:MAG: FAD-linked oxidase C-terminal domain-containing protein [Armatimonadota bacterium]|nr:FAD-linked oxidase C-terminal domain-containing protein [Armatimonadota bacterium]